MRMHVPIDIYQADVFFYDAADGALREAAASVVEKDGLRVWHPCVAGLPGDVREQLVADWPIFIQRFLRFAAVGDDAFLVALAADAQHAFRWIDIDQV